jgi:flagellar motor switch protein FliG
MRHGVELYKQTTTLKSGVQPELQDLFANQAPPKAKPAATDENTQAEESKHRRVAKFLILIGSEQAAEILSELEPEQVEAISREIALVKTIKPEEGELILKEFHELFAKPYTYAGGSKGGVETARRILYAAKGAEKGEAILNRAVPGSKENLFSFLEDFSPEQLVMLLKAETPQVTAIILSRLPPKLSAETIGKLPLELKPEVLKRIAYQKEISPEVLEQVTAALREKARHISGGAGDIEIDGMATLAAILKQGDYAFGDRIINELEVSDPNVGKDLKEKIYTLDDVVYTVDRPIQEKLASMSEQEIAILMKGRGKEFCEKLLSCVSVGRRKLIREEFEILGAVPKRDCDAAASEFLAWFRLARESGSIVLYSDRDVFV